MTNNRSDSYCGKRVLVTGGLGFIGINLCARLLDLGATVTVLDNFLPPRVSPALDQVMAGLTLVIADIRDKERVEQAVQGQEVVFNLAGKSGAADSNKFPLDDLDINCRGHLTILEACRVCSPGVTIVFPSSRLVYGKPIYLPVDERHPVVPQSVYAAHKLAVENYHLIYGELYGFKSTVLRISNPYGPFQAGGSRAYGIVNNFIQSAVTGRQIALFGNGSQRRDYLYVGDLVEVLLLAASEEAARGKIYNIGDGQGTSLLELAEMAVAVAGHGDIVQVPWPEEYRAIETGDYLSDIGLVQRELGWSPTVPILEGVVRTVEYYRQCIR